MRNPEDIAFGYGRRYVGYLWSLCIPHSSGRVCPGRYFAEQSLFMVVSNVLYALNITAPLGGDGKPVRMVCKMTEGVIS